MKISIECSPSELKELGLTNKVVQLLSSKCEIAIPTHSKKINGVDMKAYDCFHNKHAFLKVKIGKQVWMAKNLDIDDGGKGIFHNEENGEVYYTWDAAKRIADSIPGWHLPTREEWQELVDFCGSDKAGKLLKSKTGWTGKGKGTNKYGFSVPPGGYWFIGFNNVGSYAYFWTSTQYNDSYVYCQCLDSGTSVTESDYSKSRGYSVRLVQDSTK